VEKALDGENFARRPLRGRQIPYVGKGMASVSLAERGG